MISGFITSSLKCMPCKGTQCVVPRATPGYAPLGRKRDPDRLCVEVRSPETDFSTCIGDQLPYDRGYQRDNDQVKYPSHSCESTTTDRDTVEDLQDRDDTMHDWTATTYTTNCAGTIKRSQAGTSSTSTRTCPEGPTEKEADYNGETSCTFTDKALAESTIASTGGKHKTNKTFGGRCYEARAKVPSPRSQHSKLKILSQRS